MASARSAASRARSNPALTVAARVGFAVNGLLHILIGGIAVGVALGNKGEADQGGALGELARNPLGAGVLWVTTVGLVALGLYLIIAAIANRGAETKDRLKDAAKAVAYLAVGATAATFAMGGSSDSSQQTESLSATLLALPVGVALVVVLGLVVAGIGVYLAVKGIRKKFLEDLTRSSPAITALGMVGYIAKGVAIVVVGILFVVAAVTDNAKKASGLDGALKALADLPFGPIVLLAVAVGLIAFGVYSFARARLAKL
jgi:hypothetical protein